MPKVSVIVPIYGVEKYIERCLDSLFNQTLDDIEFVFIDDCSPDNSINILKAKIHQYHQHIAKMNWHVKIDRMPINSGIAAVRKYAISLTSGNFIIHCDSDDWVDYDMCRLMYDKAMQEGSDVVVSDFVVIDRATITRHIIKGCGNTDKEHFIQNLLLQTDSWSLCNKLFRKTAYKEDLFYPKGNMGEDFVLTMQLLLNCNKISYISLPLYNYSVNQMSITRVNAEDKKMENFWQNKANADVIFKLFDDKGLTYQYEAALTSNKWYIKKILWNTLFDSAKRKLWKNTYSEINSEIIINPQICIKDKIKFILTYLNLYPKM